MTVFRIAVLALFSGLLSGCGGGGGGGGGDGGGGGGGSGTNDFRVTLDRTSLTFMAIEGIPQPSQTIVATWTGTPPDPVYISATVEGTGILSTIPVVINRTSATATVSMSNVLTEGHYTGRINFLVCRDSACNQQVGGSPLPVTYTINMGNGPVATTPISFQYTAGNPLPPPHTVPVATGSHTWRVTADAPWVRVFPPTGLDAGRFDVSFDPALAVPGTQSATLTVTSAAKGTRTIPVTLTYNTPTSGGGTGAGGEFTLNTSAVNLSAKRAGPAPTFDLRLGLTGTQPVTVGAAFVNGAPDWVNVSVSGQAPNYLLRLNVTNTNLPVGTRSAVLAVGTIDSAGNVLRRQDVTVTLTMSDVISASASPIQPSFVLGSSASSASSTVSVVADPVTTWTVSSNAAWVTTSAPNGTGSGSLDVQVDASNLDIGTHTANVTFVNDQDTANTVTIPVSATVVAPTISITTGPVVIGGADGLDTEGGTLALSINTGTNTHPWTATATTANGDAWLTFAASSGRVGSTSTNIAIDANRTLVDPGTHEGTVSVQINVRGQMYTRSVPVVLNEEGHWLQASAHGAAFSSFPSRSVLSRSVRIESTRGRTDVPWSATSDASWLSVTASGSTGGTLVLTANPAGLQQDTTHIATVTIASSDPDILNEETIRVALWASATDPQNLSVSGVHSAPVANPVEPWVYTGNGSLDNTIRIYNVYTGALVDTFAPTIARLSGMAISQDGTLLFVHDSDSRAIVALNAQTGATVRSYAYVRASGGMTHINSGGRSTLIIGSGEIFDVSSGTRHSGTIDADQQHNGTLFFAVDPLNQFLYTENEGISVSMANKFSIRRTVFNQDGTVIAPVAEARDGAYGADICVSSDGARVYVANTGGGGFPVLTASTFQLAEPLDSHGLPNNAECGWNGIFVGSGDGYYGSLDVSVYRPDGSLVTEFKLADVTYSRTIEGWLVLSGDNTRVIGVAWGLNIDDVLVFKNVPAP